MAPITTLEVISFWECPLSIICPAMIPVMAEAISYKTCPQVLLRTAGASQLVALTAARSDVSALFALRCLQQGVDREFAFDEVVFDGLPPRVCHLLSPG